MAGILGDLFGLGGGTQAPTPGLLDAAGYMDPAQYDRMRQSQSMMGLWAGLLAGGGPSLTPRNFGSALGAGLTGAQQFGSQFDESQRYRAEAQKNLADITAKKQGFQIAQEYLKGGVLPGGAPGSSGAAQGSGSSTPNFGAGSGGGGGWGPHAATAIETLKGIGYSDAAIQGVMANGLGEGGFSAPWVKAGGGENSFGHWQFNAGGELPGYMAFVRAQGGDPQDTRLQALYVAKRAEEVSPGFSKLDDPKLATDIFATKFERYKGAAPGQRYGLLTDAQRYMAGQPVETREAIPAGPGGYAPEGAPAGGIPAFAGGRAAVLGGPAPAPAIMTAPGANPNVPSAPGAGAALGTGRTVVPGAPVNVRPLAGEAAPAEAAPSFGYGSAGDRISPAALAAAAGGAPPVPAAAVAPAPPVPAPAPAGALPPAAAPAPGGAVPQGAPGPMTVTLPAPPAMPPLPAIPAAQPLPAAPEMPGIPARPQIPGATPGAAVAPAVAARARQAQGVVLGLSMMGVHVPDFLQKEAGIEVAGRTAVAEAEAKQPIELQNKAFEASLTAAQKRWDALTDQQKETLAFQRGLTKDQMQAMYANVHEQYKSLLGLVTAGPIAQAQAEGALPSKLRELTGKTDEELRAAWDKPDKIVVYDAAGNPYTRIATPRQLDAEIKAGGGGVGGGGAAPTPGILTGVGPQREAELKARGAGLGADYSKIQTDATTARTQIADLKTMQSNAQNLALQGIFADHAQFANRVINGVTGQQADRVAAYELVTKNSEKLIRDATRQSDSQPAAIQLVMTRNSMPTPSTSVAGFDGVVGQMLGAQQYTVYKQQAAEQWLADPRHNNSLQGFENTLPVSPYAFMVNQMPDSQKAALAERLRSAGPAGAAEAQALAAQIRAAKAAGF